MATYEEFLNQLKESGMENQFSSYDLNLAQQNPNAGLGILSYKQQYANATTDAERAAANAGANALRSQFGYYTGGPSGSQWNPTSQMTPYTQYINPLLEQSMNYPDFSYGKAPSYNSQWMDNIKGLYGQIENYPEFDQDVTQHPLYQNYRQQAVREADRAYQDTIGAATALTNGQMSSGAMGAAAQARDYQMSKVNDQFTNIYNTLYRQYANQFDMLLQQFASAQSLEEMDYNKFLTELQQYNIDKEFAFNEWQTGFNMLQSNLGNAMNLDNSAWERNYTTNQTNFENQFNLAQLGGEYMDYSGLNALGIDTSAYEAALANTGGGGSYSGGSGTGYGDMPPQDMELFQILATVTDPYTYLINQGYTSTEAKQIVSNYEAWAENLGVQASHTNDSNSLRAGFVFPQFMDRIEGLLRNGNTGDAQTLINVNKKKLTQDEINYLNDLVLKYINAE